jgi:hypothetical protein
MSFARSLAALMLIVTTGLTAGAALAATPPKTIEYHAYATNSDGSALDGAYKVRVSLFPAETGGAAVWDETQNPVTIAGGAFSILLGSVTPLPSSLFDGTPLWIETAINDTTLAPRRPIATVPYSFHSAVADTARTLTLGGPTVFHLTDTRAGCPATAPANGTLISQALNLGATAPVTVHAQMARYALGRADLTLSVDGTPVQYVASNTSTLDWTTATVYWSGNLGPGLHTISLIGPSNSKLWGCGPTWGSMDTTVLR